MGIDRAQSQEFRPILLSRRGELTAWILALVILVVMAVFQARLDSLPPASLAVAAFFLFAALSISLGNWMDRHTVIQVDGRGIRFRNGLRDVRLGWEQIRRVQVQPSQLGDRVRVTAEEAYFQFRQMAQVQYQGRVWGRMGFEAGDEILKLIIERGELKSVSPNGPGEEYVAT